MRRRIVVLATVFTVTLALALPFVGGGGPSIVSPTQARASDSSGLPVGATSLVVSEGRSAAESADAARSADSGTQAGATPIVTADTEHLAQKPVPKPQPPVTPADARSGTSERRASLAAQGQVCPGAIGGSTGGAPARVSGQGVGGTTSDDLASFASAFNSIRVANCLPPISPSNIRYDSCMEDRLFWIAEDPSPDPASAWGHNGTPRSDGLPAVGCDGNLAGGSGNTGGTAAQKWWNSDAHRASLYRPGSGVSGVCIYFAMTHGGVPNEPASFTRAAARWVSC